MCLSNKFPGTLLAQGPHPETHHPHRGAASAPAGAWSRMEARPSLLGASHEGAACPKGSRPPLPGLERSWPHLSLSSEFARPATAASRSGHPKPRSPSPHVASCLCLSLSPCVFLHIHLCLPGSRTPASSGIYPSSPSISLCRYLHF